MSEGTSENRTSIWAPSAWAYRVSLVAIQAAILISVWAIHKFERFAEASEYAGVDWLATTIIEQFFVVVAAIIALCVGGTIKKPFTAKQTVGWAEAGALFFATLVTLNALRTGRLEQTLAGDGRFGFSLLFWILALLLVAMSVFCQRRAVVLGKKDREEIAKREVSERDENTGLIRKPFFIIMLFATFISATANWLLGLKWPGAETETVTWAAWSPFGRELNLASGGQYVLFLFVSFLNLGATFVLTWRRRQARALEELRELEIEVEDEPRKPSVFDRILIGLQNFVLWVIKLLRIVVPLLLVAAALAAALWGLWHVVQLTYEGADKWCHLKALQAICTPPEEPHWYWPDVPRFGSDGFSLGQLPWYFWAVVAGFGLGLLTLVFPWRVPGGRSTGGGVALVSLVLILLLLLLFGRSSCIVCQDYKPWLDDGPCVCEAKCEEPLGTGERCSCFGRNAEISGCGCQCENKDLLTDEEGYCRVCKDPTKVFNKDTGQCEDPIVLTPVVLPDTYWLCTNPDLAVGAGRALCEGTQRNPLSSEFYLERHGGVAQTPAILMTMREGEKEGMAAARNTICSAETVIALGAVSSGGEARNYRNNRELAHLRATTLAGTIRSVCGEGAPKVFEFALDRQDCAIQGDSDTCGEDEYVDRAITVIVVKGTRARTITRPELMQVFNAYLSDMDEEQPGPLQHVGDAKGFENEAVIVETNQPSASR